MRRSQAGLLAFVLGIGVVACGGPPPSHAAAVTEAEPRWEDALDTVPELLLVVRPKALRKDRVYGPLLRGAIRAARDRSRVVAATGPLEALEDADEVVVGVRADTGDQPGEFLLVERGVRSDVDPGQLVDDDGKPLWSAGPSGPTRELVREQAAPANAHGDDASLFELPGRTWVIATGAARARARVAFAHPARRPSLVLEPTALAAVRIDGPSLVAHVRGLQDLGALGAVGRRLRAATFALPPGPEGTVTLTLTYADEDAAAFSEVTIREAIGAEANAKGADGTGGNDEHRSWLGAALAMAKVERPDKRVVVTAPLPARLIDALLNAGKASFDDVIPPKAPARSGSP